MCVWLQVYERSSCDVLYVDLFTGPRSKSLSDKLVALSLAHRTHSKPHLQDDVIPPPMMITAGDRLDVEIIAAQTPWDFYFQDVRKGSVRDIMSYFTLYVMCMHLHSLLCVCC